MFQAFQRRLVRRRTPPVPPYDLLWEVRGIGIDECRRRRWETGFSQSIYHGKEGRLVFCTEGRDYDNHIEIDPQTGSVKKVVRRVHHATDLERALGLAGVSLHDER